MSEPFSAGESTLARARARLSERTLRFSLLFLPFIALSVVSFGWRWASIAYLALIVISGTLGFTPSSEKWRRFTVVATNGIAALLIAIPTRGFTAGPLVVAAFFCIYATLLYGRWTGLGATVLSVIGLLIVGHAHAIGWLVSPPLGPGSGGDNWFAAGLTVGSYLLIPTFPIIVFLHEITLAARSRAKALDATISEEARRKAAIEAQHLAQIEVSDAQRQRTLGRMAGGLAHEINGVLQEIEGWIEVLRREGDPDDADHSEAVREMRDSVRRAAAVGRRLLYMGGQNLSAVRSTDLDEFLRRVHGTLTTAAGPGVSVDLATERTQLVLADTTELTHVLVNLVVNSRDALSGKGSIRIRLAPDSPSLEGGASGAVIAVSDDGPGIPAEILPRVFEPFFTTKGRRGTGLGLAIVKRLLEGIGGRVEIDSAPGHGTNIRLFIPAAPAESDRLDAATSLAHPQAQIPSQRSSIRAPVLLFVEDQPSIRQVFVKVVARAGIRILVAESVDDALQHLDHERPDLIWSDAIMPGSPTSQLIARAKELEIPIVICSGHVEEELLRRDIRTQELEFVPKPYTARQLIARTRQAALDRWGQAGSGPLVPSSHSSTQTPSPHAVSHTPAPPRPITLPPLELDQVTPLRESGAFPSAAAVPHLDETPDVPPSSDERLESDRAARPLRVLVADDDDSVRRSFQRGLTRLGFQVFEASDGLEAEFVFLSNPGIDVVVLDAEMPHRNGDATARSILRARPTARIVICTGNEHTTLPPGIREVIVKPIALGDLAEVIRRIALSTSERTPRRDSKPASHGGR